MVYPTPGFVVRQTFLEFEPESSADVEDPETPQVGQGLRRGRALSDTFLARYQGQVTAPSQFGSEDLRLYYEGLQHRGAEETAGTSPGGEDAEVALQGRAPSPVPHDAAVASAAEPLAPWTASPEAAQDPAGVPGDEQEVPSDDERTTLQLEGLPGEYNRNLLMETLDSHGFAGSYNLVYLPLDLCTRTGLGYALVNFASHGAAKRALQQLEGLSQWQVRSSEVCRASWGKYCQGLEALVERYRNSPVMHERVPDINKPLVLEAGVPVAFPPPTRRVRMPRQRQMQGGEGLGRAAADPSAGAPPQQPRRRAAPGGARARRPRGAGSEGPAPAGGAEAVQGGGGSLGAGSGGEVWYVDLVASTFNYPLPAWWLPADAGGVGGKAAITPGLG